jgi:uncharacterized protein DUF2809
VFHRRLRYFVLAILTILVGLIVHFDGRVLSFRVRDILGDALWAMMMVWWMGVALPRVRLSARGLAAFGICVAVELSQRYHTAFLDAARLTIPGQLILGSGYDPRDFLAYAAGVIAAVTLAQVVMEPANQKAAV